MSIQGNVNQALGIGAALLSQTGRAQTVREQAAAKRELKSINKTQETIAGLKPSPGEEVMAGDIQQADSLTGIIQRKYQLALKTGNVKAAQDALAFMDELEDVNASYANMRAGTKATGKKAQAARIHKAIGGKDGNN